MDLDLAFVATLVLSDDPHSLKALSYKGLTADHLRNEDARKAYSFVLDYAKEYKTVPNFDLVFGKTGVQLDQKTQGDFGFFVDEVLNRELHANLKGIVVKVASLLDAKEIGGAHSAYLAGLAALREAGLGMARTESLMGFGDEFLDHYDKLKAGFRGILTPWRSINDSTLGFWPEDFVLFVARMGVGKTWCLIQIAHHAWKHQDKKVLFVTTEMSKVKIYQRWAALNWKLPYNHLRKGELPIFQEEIMRKGIDELREEQGLNIVGGDFDFTFEGLEAAVDECEPDLVIVDGLYLMRSGGDGRTEKAANTFDATKRLAKRLHLPFVTSTQFNREVKQNKASSMSAEKIALSDAAGWNADLVYGMAQTEDMKRDKRLLIKPLKFREGTSEDIECWWDFDTMTFDEVSGAPAPGPHGGLGSPGAPPAAGAPDTDEFSTGILQYSQTMDEEDAPF